MRFKHDMLQSTISVMHWACHKDALKHLKFRSKLVLGYEQITLKPISHIGSPESSLMKRRLPKILSLFTLCFQFSAAIYSPSCLSHETTKWPCGLWIKLPPVVSTTQGEIFTCLVSAERQAVNTHFKVFVLTWPGIEPMSTSMRNRHC